MCYITIHNKANLSEEWGFHAIYKKDGRIVNESKIRTETIEAETSLTANFINDKPVSGMICVPKIDNPPIHKECSYSFYSEKKKPVTVTLYQNVTVEKNVAEAQEVPCGAFGKPVGFFKRIGLFFKYLFS